MPATRDGAGLIRRGFAPSLYLSLFLLGSAACLPPSAAMAASAAVTAEIEAILQEAGADQARDQAAYGSLANPEVLATKLQQLRRRTEAALAGVARREAALGASQGREAAAYIALRAPEFAASAQQAAVTPQAGNAASRPVSWYAAPSQGGPASPPIRPTLYAAAPAGPGRPGQWYDNPFLARYSVTSGTPIAASPGLASGPAMLAPAPGGAVAAATAAVPDVWDPLEPLNRIFFSFNEVVDTFLLRPVAWLYSFSPDPVKTGVRNVLRNLKSPVTMLNHGLQGEMTEAATTVGRFAVNSTVGLLGLWDPADEWLQWKHRPADFGQTLHGYGLGNGPFLMLPLLGPTNLRDGVGTGVDSFADPLMYVLNDNARLGLTGANVLSRRESLLIPLDELRAGSVDYYTALRSSQQQQRAAFLQGGAPPSAQQIKATDDLFNETK